MIQIKRTIVLNVGVEDKICEMIGRIILRTPQSGVFVLKFKVASDLLSIEKRI